MINLRWLFKVHSLNFNIFYSIQSLYFSVRVYLILKQVNIFGKYRIICLFISITIKLICFFNLCFDYTLFKSRRIDAVTFRFIIHIFLNCIITLHFFQWSVNIFGLHKIYIRQTKSYLLF